MCCRSHCSCGCGSSSSSGNGTGSNGCGGQRPVCGWAYLCQYPGHFPMPLAERASALLEEYDCGCG